MRAQMETVGGIQDATELIARADVEHRTATRAARTAFRAALEAGRLLNRARDRCAHGEWLDLLDTHFSGAPRTARRYMQLADGWPRVRRELEDDDALTVDRVLKLIAESNRRNAAERQEKQLGTLVRATRYLMRSMRKIQTRWPADQRKALARKLEALAAEIRANGGIG